MFILKGVEETSRETILQIEAINKLFAEAQDMIKDKASNLYDKELLELLFEQPYCKTEFVVDRLKISRVTVAKYLKGLEQSQAADAAWLLYFI